MDIKGGEKNKAFKIVGGLANGIPSYSKTTRISNLYPTSDPPRYERGISREMLQESDGPATDDNCCFARRISRTANWADYEVEGDMSPGETKLEGMYKGDENEERGNWNNKCEFLLSIIGYCVGLGNVWRFPYKAYKNGGGAFLLPYWLIAILVGFPLFLLEASIGQYTSRGCTDCWQLAPLFSGLGLASFALITICSIYYNVIISWSLYYLFASFTSDLPWQYCSNMPGHEWITWTNYKCDLAIVPPITDCSNHTFVSKYYNTSTFGAPTTTDDLRSWQGEGSGLPALNQTGDLLVQEFNNGTCWVKHPNGQWDVLGIFNQTVAKTFGITSQMPAEQYFYNYVIGENESTSIDNIGGLRWQNALCLTLGWLIVFFALIHGIKSAGKVVYFTAVFPYVGLFALLIQGLLLEGGVDGIVEYITPNFERLKDGQVWLDAAIQLFYSLGPAWGSIIALSSYNNYHGNVLLDASVAVLADSLTSLLAGFTVFSYIGHYAHEKGIAIQDAATDGPGLVFVIYPSALTYLPVSSLWAILFFFTLLLIALDSSFNMVEGILTGCLDRFPRFRKNLRSKITLFAGICFIMYLIGLCMCTAGGEKILYFFDSYTAGWPILIIALLECVAVGWVYGPLKFSADIRTMVPMFNKPISYIFGTLICVVSPLVISIAIIMDWINKAPISSRGYHYPEWSFAIGNLINVFEVSPIVIMAIYVLFRNEGSLWQRIKTSLKPTIWWGPALVKYRKLVAESGHLGDGFIVDPARYQEDLMNDSKDFEKY